jgi:hypothetical protein
VPKAVSIAGFSIAEYYVISPESIVGLTTKLTGGFGAQRVFRPVQHLSPLDFIALSP